MKFLLGCYLQNGDAMKSGDYEDKDAENEIQREETDEKRNEQRMRAEMMIRYLKLMYYLCGKEVRIFGCIRDYCGTRCDGNDEHLHVHATTHSHKPTPTAHPCTTACAPFS